MCVCQMCAAALLLVHGTTNVKRFEDQRTDVFSRVLLCPSDDCANRMLSRLICAIISTNPSECVEEEVEEIRQSSRNFSAFSADASGR